MRKIMVMAVVILGSAAVAMAGDFLLPLPGGPVTVPEIDVASGMAALTLVGSAVLVIRSHRKQ